MKVATKQIDTEKQAVTFHFSNGKKLVCEIDQVSAEIATRFCLHGISQKVGDCYAAATENGWSVDQCLAEATAVWSDAVAGNWVQKGRTSSVVDAMVEVFGRTFEECSEVWGKLDAKGKRDVAKDPSILKFLAERELERAGSAKATIDVKALFAKKKK